MLGSQPAGTVPTLPSLQLFSSLTCDFCPSRNSTLGATRTFNPSLSAEPAESEGVSVGVQRGTDDTHSERQQRLCRAELWFPLHRQLRQEDQEFEVNLSYIEYWASQGTRAIPSFRKEESRKPC